ncbi:hypothetical protein RGQ13_11775 [Thalassotalea psychrophila]|uniref:Uncharacterized protein n=1 Tax=Thalassotalea psychrophila TaxID=3065647 RepID=A0ABY9TQ14_9GAMM|nr:hypothetical protein RGQ13_11775 [Colwelliaceae bacterium SQ149]
MKTRKHSILKKKKQVEHGTSAGQVLTVFFKLLLNSLPFIAKGFYDILKTQITGKSNIHQKTNIYRNKADK